MKDLTTLLRELQTVEQTLNNTTDRSVAAVLIRRKENLVAAIAEADEREFPRDKERATRLTT